MGFNGSDEFADVWDMLFPVELTAVALDTTSRFSTTFTATSTASSATLSSIADTSHLQYGMVVSGTNIPANAYITAITSSTVTLSATATGSGTNTMTAAMYLYDWKEKAYDSATGAVIDVVGGRAGSYALEPAVELTNQQVSIPSYVWGRYRSSPAGEQMFEFVAPGNTGGNVYNTTINYGNTVQTNNTYINYYGSVSFPTYITFNTNVNISFNTPIYLGACLISEGAQPTAPSNAPTITVGGGGSGSWPSGTYYFKITYVDYTGSESSASPESAQKTALGSPNMAVALNNTPGSTISYWRIYVTPTNGASNSETLVIANAGATTVYDIPVGTTTYALPAPIWTSTTPPASTTNTPGSCMVLPAVCGKPTYTGRAASTVVDLCATPPTFWVEYTKPTGTAWKNVIGTSAKGDLITNDGTNSVNQSVGANGKILRAESSASNGIEWATLAAGTNMSITNVAGTITFNASSGTPSTAYGQWIKLDVDYTNFSGAGGSSFDYQAASLGAGGVVMMFAWKITQDWLLSSGDTFSATRFNFGDTTDLPLTLMSTWGTSISNLTSSLSFFTRKTPAQNAFVYVTVQVATALSHLTQGHLQLWVFVANLP